MSENLGFVGLGVMGAPMCAHLLSAGHNVTVWSRNPAKSEPLQAKGAKPVENLERLADECSVVFLCVSRTEDVEEVVAGLDRLPAGALIVDHSTIDPAGCRRIAEGLSQREVKFLDAPVTGGEKGAVAGTLTVFCGGHAADYERALPYLNAYAKTAKLVGPQGTGQAMKMANQIAVALAVLAMCECLVFADKAGLSLEGAIELIGSGAGGSWSMSNYGPKVLARDWSPGFSVALQQKDLVYALSTARELGVSLPGTALVHQLFAALENAGRSDEATPALFDVIESLSGRM